MAFHIDSNQETSVPEENAFTIAEHGELSSVPESWKRA